MSDKGVIFSAPMVRALLDGRKTQTRRLIKPAPFIDDMGNFCAPDRKRQVWNWGQNIDGTPCLRNFVKKMPSAPGDRLYVRENFQLLSFGDYLPTKSQPADVRFAATDPCADLPVDARGYPWRPCIHMPRWASRLWLAVTDVRVQRLQDISRSDAIDEGVDELRFHVWRDYSLDASSVAGLGDPRESFRTLWNTLHTKPGERWEGNPWIVAVSFDVHRGNIDAADSAATPSPNERTA